MDRSTSSNVRLFGGDGGAIDNNRGDVKNVYHSLSNGASTDKQNISLDSENPLFHIEMPLPIDQDMESTLYHGADDDDVTWIVSRKDDDGVSGDCNECGAVHLRNVDCPTPEYSDDPKTYENWEFWRPTTPPPLPSKSEFYAGAAQSPQDMDTDTTNTTDDFPEDMPPNVVATIKEALNGQSYTDWKNSAKTKMNALFHTTQARSRAIARDLALCDADRRRRERLEREEAFERRAKEEGDEHRRRRRRRRHQRHASH